MDEWLDEPTSIRSGEEIPLEKLEAYLQKELSIIGKLAIRQFPSGFSNLTYQLKFGDQKLVLRRPPFGAKIKSGHDMGREYKILYNLKKVYSKVPEPFYYTEDESILGAPFYIMEKVEGIILRAKKPKEITPDKRIMSGIAKSVVDEFAALHIVDVENAGLSDLGRPKGYVERQIDGWTKRYYKSKTDEIVSIEKVAKWLVENRPPESGNRRG